MSPADIAELERRLRGLRARARAWLALAGCATLAGAAVAAAAMSLFIDRLARMDRAQRAVFLALACGFLVWVAARSLVAPLLARIDDEGLCLLVEKTWPRLGSSLITSLQLARVGAPPGVDWSPALVKRAVADGLCRARAVDFDAVLDRGHRDRCLLAGGALVLLCVGACVFSPVTMGIWFRRNVLLADEEWPRRTRLRVLGVKNGVCNLPRGGDLEILVEADASPGMVVPATVDLLSRFAAGEPPRKQAIGMISGHRFRAVCKAVNTPFEFKVRGGDDETAWIKVVLLPRPRLEELRILVTPPAYTGAKRRRAAPGRDVYEFLAGTSITLQGRCSQPLERVMLQVPGTGERAVALAGKSDFRLPLGRAIAGTYGLLPVDTAGVQALVPARFTVRLRPDAKPRVKLGLEGVSDIVLPRARIPLSLAVEDDYAVAAAALVVQINNSEEEQQALRRIELPELVTLGKHRRAARAQHALELPPLKLEPEARLAIRLEARDNDTVSGPKTARSAAVVLRVVTEEEFRAAILRRERVLRREFDQLYERQQRLLEQVRIALSTKVAGERTLPARQQGVGKGVARLARVFMLLAAEVENNRLEENSGPMLRRLRGRIAPALRSLAAGELAAAAAGLAAGDLVEARRAQVAALARMREIRAGMVRSEDFQDAVNTLRRIIERQKRLREDTVREARKGLEEVFE